MSAITNKYTPDELIDKLANGESPRPLWYPVTATLTADEREALAKEFPRINVANNVVPDSPLARALKKLVPEVLPQRIFGETGPFPVDCDC